jgi:hypothetical protein
MPAVIILLISMQMERPICNFLNLFTLPLLWGIETYFKKCKNRSEKHYYNINSLDQKIRLYLPKYNGFYVELCTNDGISQSNTLYFERYKN